MDDHQRFTKQMDEAFQYLMRIMEELPVPLATRDKISMYVGRLREAAYQAGRTERQSGSLQRQRKDSTEVFRYPIEFGDAIKVEPQIESLVLKGYMTDESWHNNTLAHFERVMVEGKILLLWIAEEDPSEREDENVSRYTVELAGSEGSADPSPVRLLSTEDTEEAYAFVLDRIGFDLKLRQTKTDEVQ